MDGVLALTIVLATLMVVATGWILTLLRRNSELSESLIRNAELASQERLALTRQHAEQRENLRIECMFRLDSMQRDITHSFSQLLAEKLTAALARSRTGPVR